MTRGFSTSTQDSTSQRWRGQSTGMDFSIRAFQPTTEPTWTLRLVSTSVLFLDYTVDVTAIIAFQAIMCSHTSHDSIQTDEIWPQCTGACGPHHFAPSGIAQGLSVPAHKDPHCCTEIDSASFASKHKINTNTYPRTVRIANRMCWLDIHIIDVYPIPDQD